MPFIAPFFIYCSIERFIRAGWRHPALLISDFYTAKATCAVSGLKNRIYWYSIIMLQNVQYITVFRLQKGTSINGSNQ